MTFITDDKIKNKIRTENHFALVFSKANIAQKICQWRQISALITAVKFSYDL